MEIHIHLAYPSALQPDKWPRESAGPIAQVSEYFAHHVKAADMQNEKLTTLDYRGTWNRITPWCPGCSWPIQDTEITASGHCHRLEQFLTAFSGHAERTPISSTRRRITSTRSLSRWSTTPSFKAPRPKINGGRRAPSGATMRSCLKALLLSLQWGRLVLHVPAGGCAPLIPGPCPYRRRAAPTNIAVPRNFAHVRQLAIEIYIGGRSCPASDHV